MATWEYIDDVVTANNIRAAERDAQNGNTNAMKLSLNKFSDYTEAEFRAMLTGSRPRGELIEGEDSETTRSSGGRLLQDLPLSVDHGRREGGLNNMPAVKDQATCGSCWTFAATAVLEGILTIESGSDYPPISNQMLVDCTRAPPKGKRAGFREYDGLFSDGVYAYGC